MIFFWLAAQYCKHLLMNNETALIKLRPGGRKVTSTIFNFRLVD